MRGACSWPASGLPLDLSVLWQWRAFGDFSNQRTSEAGMRTVAQTETSLCFHASLQAERNPSLGAALTSCPGSSSQRVAGAGLDISS